MNKNSQNIFKQLLESVKEDKKTILEGKKWIQDIKMKKGALTKTAKAAGAVKGGKIKKEWIKEKAKKDDKTGRRARLALTLGKLRKEGLAPDIIDRILVNLLKECDLKYETGPKGLEHTNTKNVAKVPKRKLGLKECDECEIEVKNTEESKEVPISDENVAAIKDFITSHPNLDDKEFHEFVISKNIKPEEAEEIVYKWVNDLAKENEQSPVTNEINKVPVKESYSEFLNESMYPKVSKKNK